MSPLEFSLIGLVATLLALLGGVFAYFFRAQKHLKQELASTEGKLRAVFETAPVSMMIYDLDDAEVPWRIVDCNAYAAELHAWERRKLIGQSLRVIAESHLTYQYAQARKATLLAEGSARGQARHVRRDGRVLHISYVAQLIELDGRSYMLGIDIDTTALKAAEAGLRASEERFRSIINVSPDSIMLLDPHDVEVPVRIVDCNPRAARMHGYAIEEMTGMNVQQLNPDSFTKAEALEVLRRAQAGEVVTGQAVHVRRDGTTLPVEYRISFVHFNKRDYLVAIDRDVSQRHREEAERRQLHEELQDGRRLRAMGSLAGGFAHEFNNLLTPIMLRTELISATWTGTDALMAEHIDAIKQAATRSRDLVKRILTFSRRSKAGQQEVEVGVIIAENVDLLRAGLDRRIALSIGGPPMPELAWIMASRSDLGQVFMNLLINARDAVVRRQEAVGGEAFDAEIEVSWASCAGIPQRDGIGRAGVLVRVRDTGVGMDEQTKERIFEPFFTTKPVGQGVGLGLATSWHVVNAAGGNIDVNTTPNQGTTFSVWLPTCPAPRQAESAPAQVSETVPLRAERTGHVVLIEDDALVGQTLRALLSHRGYTVNWVQNPLELDKDEVAHAKLVLTDLNLPEKNGQDIARDLRADGYVGRIIAISGRVTPEREKALKLVGVDAVLAKPFERKELDTVLSANGL